MNKKPCYHRTMTDRFSQSTFADTFNTFAEKFSFEDGYRKTISQTDTAMWSSIMGTFFQAVLKREVAVHFARDVAAKFIRLNGTTAWSDGNVDPTYDFVSNTLEDQRLRHLSYAFYLDRAVRGLHENDVERTPENLRSAWLRIIRRANVNRPEVEHLDIEEDFGSQMA